MNHIDPLPVLARLLPKLKMEPAVVAAPKQPALKLIAAGFGFKPIPPKLNPPAVVLPAPSPPNPAAKAGRQRRRREQHGGGQWQCQRSRRLWININLRVQIRRASLRKTIHILRAWNTTWVFTGVGGAKAEPCGRRGCGRGCAKSGSRQSCQNSNRTLLEMIHRCKNKIIKQRFIHLNSHPVVITNTDSWGRSVTSWWPYLHNVI